MTELQTLQQLERETGLLASRGDVEHMRRTSYQFTVLAASRLRRQGWRLLKAPPGGNNIDGVRIDKLINANTLEMVDVIVNADDPDGPPRQPAWQPVGIGRPADVADAQAQPPDQPPPPPPTPGPIDLPDDEIVLQLVAVCSLIAERLADNTVVMHKLLEKVAEVQRDGVRLRFR